MRPLITTIFTCLLFVFSACNTEEGLQPVSENSYIKIIQGEGTDAPLSIQEFNGDLLIVSNSTIRGSSANKIRVLRTDLNGDVINGSGKYFPENMNQAWNVKDVIVIENQRIVLGGTVGNNNDSLFFLEINAQLDSVRSEFYSSDMENYQLTGLSYDESTSKIFFGGFERIEDGEEYTLFGQLNASDLSIEENFRSSKAKALPATPILEDASGGLIWAYNTANSELVRSPNRSMQQIDDIDNLRFNNAENIVSKKLLKAEDGKILILGELDDLEEQQRMLFFYEVYSGDDPIIFGGTGENQLNGVKKSENGYLIAGSTEVDEGGGQLDFYLSRRGQNGGESFSSSFGSDADEELHDAVMINDFIYSIGSTTIGIENTLLLIKTDKFGRFVN